jgi:hypothetical protein
MTIFTEPTTKRRTFQEAMETRARLMGSFGRELIEAMVEGKCSNMDGLHYSNELLTYAEQVREAAEIVNNLSRTDRTPVAWEVEAMEKVASEWVVRRFLKEREG